jgi:hypothetical protein
LKIGWCYTQLEGTTAFPSPSKFHLPKDPSPTKRGHFSCPAVRATTEGCFVIKSPFSLRLRYEQKTNVGTFVPIYPFTSITDHKLSEWFRPEPTNTWRSFDIPIFQFPSPYIFVADEQIEIELIHPFISDISSLNWRLIPGRFNIYGWQRPLNWAAEWDARCGDLIIKLGDPLYYIRFYDDQKRIISHPDLVKIKFTDEIKERVQGAAGVTSFRRGTQALIREESESRNQNLIVPLKNE